MKNDNDPLPYYDIINSNLWNLSSIIVNWITYITNDPTPAAGNGLKNKICFIIIPALLEGAEERSHPDRLKRWKLEAVQANDEAAIFGCQMIEQFDQAAIDLCSIYSRAEMELIHARRHNLVHTHVERAPKGQSITRWVEDGKLLRGKPGSPEAWKNYLKEARKGSEIESADAIRIKFMDRKSIIWPLVFGIFDPWFIELLKITSKEMHNRSLNIISWRDNIFYYRASGAYPKTMAAYSLNEAHADGHLFRGKE